MNADIHADVHPALSAPALEWMARNAALEPPLSVEFVVGGRSNLTFVVTDAAGQSVVARRPPLGRLLPKAHDVGREFRLLSALVETEVSVPRPVAMCSDLEILGVPFYVMSFVAGAVPENAYAADALDVDRQRASRPLRVVLFRTPTGREASRLTR